MTFLRRLACSFCGKSSTEVAKLVAGPRVYICDGCVDLAKHIMDDSDGESTIGARRSTLVRRIASRLRQLIANHRDSRLPMDGAIG